MRASSLLCLGVVLAGCPNNQRPVVDAGTASIVGRACDVDGECGPLRCDKIRRQCICLSDESCRSADPSATALYCNNYTGLCVAEITGCKSDSECDPTQYCDPSIRSCRTLKTFCEVCSADRECGGANDNCVEDATDKTKYCATACASTADCPRGASCLDKSGKLQCWPTQSPLPGQPASCKSFRGCVPNSLRTCNTTADCAQADQRCDPASGKCVAVEQVCPYGTTCDPRAKICVADCTVDADCGDAKLRCQNKICEPVGDCTMDSQCPANKVCSIPPGAGEGKCAPFCQQDLDCPIGSTCQKQGDRYKCLPGCATNANCRLDQRCNQTSKQCEGPTVGSARVCQATASCRTCELCNTHDATKPLYECASAKTSFPHCQPCNSSVDCSGGTCVSLDDGRFCAQPCGITPADCPQGFVCLATGTGQQVCVPSSRTCSGKCT